VFKFHFCRLLTFFIKLCLLRGFTTAVNLAFASDINEKDHTHDLPGLTCPPQSCSFEHFLSQWSNSWLVFDRKSSSTAKRPYNTLSSIVFTDRISGFCHVEIKGVHKVPVHDAPTGHLCETNPLAGTLLALQRLASGDWSSFPPVSNTPYNVFNSCCLRMWDSPPTEDPKPQNIEKMPSTKSTLEVLRSKFLQVTPEEQAEEILSLSMHIINLYLFILKKHWHNSRAPPDPTSIKNMGSEDLKPCE
jgi:hypothetical protein